MKVMLGDFELRPSEQPDTIQMGGGSMLAVKQFPGGNVSIQNFGPLYDDISWEGWFEGPDAKQRMYTIGNMRQKGDPIVFSTDCLSNNVIISEFKCNMKCDTRIPFSIVLKRIITLKAPPDPKENVDKIAEKVVEEAQQESPPQNVIEYVVKKGDCLWNIAGAELGDASRWGEIFEDNKDIIKPPNIIQTGQKLVIKK